MANLFDLTGKVATVVGGGGMIGRAIASGLAEHGADVVVADYRLDHAEEVADKICPPGKKTLAVHVDITKEQSVADMVTAILKVFPHLDILVNCAGVIIRKPADTFPMSDWERIMDVNNRGTFLCCQAVGRVMIKQGGGKIINISSIRATRALADNYVVYSASKGAVDALTRILAFEWAKYHVLVNAIAPNIVETEITREVFSDPEFVKLVKSRIPLGHWGVPEDFAGPTVFLASKASDFVTGQILHVDGGETTW